MSNAIYSLDTSVLMRLLVKDPLPLFQVAAQFLEEQLRDGATVEVSDLVLAEAYFALQTAYDIPKAESLQILAHFVQQGDIKASSAATAVLALPNLATAKPGFVDRLIHQKSQTSGHTLVTFEKAMKKLPDTVVL